MTGKLRAVVIFPGRGSYGSSELGYLARYHGAQNDWIERFDELRFAAGAERTLELDGAARFSPSRHLPGRNASNLIYTCAMADFAAIDRQTYEIAAICGNSLGWYLSLAAAGALSLEDGAYLVDTMGHMMQQQGVGGQLLYRVAGEDWRIDARLRTKVLAQVEQMPDAFLSIDLGGTLVLAGDKPALQRMQAELPPPASGSVSLLPQHAAFHTPLLSDIAKEAQRALPAALFGPPEIPMIDGSGKIWSPFSCDAQALHSYTLGGQITGPYDFAKSLEVAMKEFAPDCLILAGPGTSLGAPIGQALMAHTWQDIASRDDFTARQDDRPYLLAMGRPDQRARVTGT